MPRMILYVLSGAIVLINALGMLFIPERFLGLFGLQADEVTAWVSRMMAAVMLANVYLFWRLRDAPRESIGARFFSQGQIIAWGLTAVVLLIGIFTLGAAPSAWLQVLVCAALAVLSGLDAFRS